MENATQTLIAKTRDCVWHQKMTRKQYRKATIKFLENASVSKAAVERTVVSVMCYECGKCCSR